jgi:hypothetical protein
MERILSELNKKRKKEEVCGLATLCGPVLSKKKVKKKTACFAHLLLPAS